IQILASGAVLLGRPTPARSAALLRSVRPSPTTSTTVEPTTLPPPPPPTAPPVTRAPAPAPPPLPSEPAARLGARPDAALGSVRSCLIVQDGDATVYGRAGDLALAPA